MLFCRRLKMIVELNRGLPYTTQPIEIKRIASHDPLFNTVRHVFENDLPPLFGDQREALKKITEGKNRGCEIALSQENPVGFVVWKKNNEENSFIVTNLHLINPEINSVSTVVDALIRNIFTYARRNAAERIKLTIPEKDSELFEVLKSKNFNLLETKKISSTGLFKHLLSYNLPKKPIDLSTSSNAIAPVLGETGSNPDMIRKKRSREESEPKQTETSALSETSDPLENPSRKKTAINTERSEPNRGRDRDSHPPTSSHSRSDSRTDSRKGTPISGPFTRGSEYDRDRRQCTPHYNFNPYNRNYEGVNQIRAPHINNSSNIERPTHSATLMKKYIHQIRDGGKTIEGRINTGMFLRFKAGETVRFFYTSNPSDDVTCRIVKVAAFSNFPEMLEKEGFQKCLTDIRTLSEAIRIYDNIPGYKEKAARFGVLAIHLEVIKR